MRKILLAFLFMLLPGTLLAQSNLSTIRVNYPETNETNEQQITVYFTPLDADGNSVSLLPANAPQATIHLGDQDYPATISVPDTPLDLVLVLDTSGSMGGAGPQMVSAAQSAVQQAPAGTRFTVITFNEASNIRPIVTDNDNQAQVNAAISGITTFEGGTCLYDATMRGLQQLQSTGRQGRRAVIVFTDGRDERMAGGELDPCSQSTQNDVVNTATNVAFRIPVHTIGMQGGQPIAVQPLETIASSTGGRAVIGDSSQLTSMFAQIINDLLNQRAATATVCVSSGTYSGFMQLGSGFSSPISVPVNNVIFNTDCTLPTPTPTLEASGLVVRPPYIEANDLVFDISMSGSIPPTRYQVTVIDEETNTQLPAPYGSMTIDPANPQIRLPLSQVNAQALTLTVEALDAGGDMLATYTVEDVQPRRTPTPAPPPTATPLALGISIPGISYDAENQLFSISVNAPANEAVVGYIIRITDQTGSVVESLERRQPPSNPIIVHETDLEEPLLPGEYRFVIELIVPSLQASGNPPTSDPYQIIKPPPVLPPWYARFAGNIVALIGLVLVTTAVIAGVVYFFRKDKKSSKKGDDELIFVPDDSQQQQKQGQYTELSIEPSVAMSQSNIAGRLRVVQSTHYPAGKAWDISPKQTPVHIGNPKSPRSHGRNLFIKIPDGSVSGVHISIHFDSGAFTIVDEASRNGTALDNDMLSPNKRYALQRFHTSEINIAMNHIFSFRYVVNGKELESDPTEPENPPLVSEQPIHVNAPAQPPNAGMSTRKLPTQADMLPATGKLTDSVKRTEQPNAIPADIAASLQVTASPDMSAFASDTISVNKPLFWIGRDETMTLTIPEKAISTTHACIFWQDGKFQLADYSSNGTWLDGKQLKKEAPYTLHPDTEHEIQLARNCTTLIFSYSHKAETSKPTTPKHTEAERETSANGKPAKQDIELASERMPKGVKPQLTITQENGLEVKREVPIEEIMNSQGTLTIGRVEERDCTVHSSHVSRLHATLVWHKNQFYIVDHESQNGVFVNSDKIDPGVPFPLKAGQPYVIYLGYHPSEPTAMQFTYRDTRTQMSDMTF